SFSLSASTTDAALNNAVNTTILLNGFMFSISSYSKIKLYTQIAGSSYLIEKTFHNNVIFLW
ncbi:MAG: hypothetical protein ACKVKR_13435, partial [Pseudomonadales bacterium]